MAEESVKKEDKKEEVELLSAKTVRDKLTSENIDERLQVLDAYDQLMLAKKTADLNAERAAQQLEETKVKLAKAQDDYRKAYMRIPLASEEDPTDPFEIKKKLKSQITLDDLINEGRK